MTTTSEIVTYLDDILETTITPDFPGAVNGLQVANRGNVTKVAAAVDFSARSIAAAIDAQADLLLVHHGMFWNGVHPITGPAYERMRLLLDHDIAVYSSHLPLDKHAHFGNNVLLAEVLGLDASERFARYQTISIGVRGESNIDTAELLTRAQTFARKHGGDAVATEYAANRQTLRWAICTGAGASADTLNEAADLGVDTLIVGEGPHWTAVAAAEMGIVIIYAGHYATETLGVNALAHHLAERFQIGWTMIHAPTGL
ncbi:MAG TPA: Nif3-like dinuclear metal center hexameric protein [Gemmatimonadaceae bacterium]|nr:Nif3-like dinuclear metal center hexameric protein [Gemmatimonadaceae bacterium]